jgi:GWxTD domain-containing protein
VPASYNLLALFPLLITAVQPLAAQTMPGPVYNELVAGGHERLARELSKKLDLRADPDRGDVEKLLARWGGETGGPESGYDWLAAARLWLRAGQAVEAGQALRRAEGHVPGGLYLLEVARISFLAGTPRAADAYWRSCELADEASGLEAWLDIEPLATPAEMAAWDRFRTLPAGQRDDCAFLSRFWNRRAAASGLEVDARIEQHYSRLRYARKHFRRRGKEGPVLSARLGRPRYSMFDDRGLLHVRMGEPDETASFLGDEALEPNVTWAYDYPGGYRLYHLSPLGGTDDWWLLGNLAQVVRGDDPERNPFVAIPSMLAFMDPGVLHELYLSRSGLDPAYARIAYRAMSAAGDRLLPLSILEELREEREWTREDAELAVAGVPERPDVDLEVRFGLEWLQFKASRSGHTRVWLNGMVEADRLKAVPLPDGGLRYRFGAVWTVIDGTGEFYRRLPADFQVDWAEALEDDTGLSVRIPAELPSGSYAATVAVSDANDEPRGDRRSGGYATLELTVRNFRGDTPMLSDVAVASDSGGVWTPGGELYLSPTPAHATGADGVAYVYYEAYNLTPGGEYLTRARLEPADGEEAFELTYPGSAPAGDGDVTHGFLRLDLSDTRPGAYHMSVTVRDIATGIETLPTRTEVMVNREGDSLSLR